MLPEGIVTNDGKVVGLCFSSVAAILNVASLVHPELLPTKHQQPHWSKEYPYEPGAALRRTFAIDGTHKLVVNNWLMVSFGVIVPR